MNIVTNGKDSDTLKTGKNITIDIVGYSPVSGWFKYKSGLAILTLSGPTSGDFSRIQSKIHASDKYILRFISVRSMSGPERVNKRAVKLEMVEVVGENMATTRWRSSVSSSNS